MRPRILEILTSALVLLTASVVRAEEPLSTYPGTTHTRIGTDLVIAGDYHRMAYFTTPDSIEQVARYFVKTWDQQGYPTTVDGEMRENVVVSAFQTREGLQRSVVLGRHQDKTVGFTVLRDLWVRPPRRSAPTGVKLEGALLSVESSVGDDESSAQSQGTLVRGSLAKVRDQLLAGYRAQGYSLVVEKDHQSGASRQKVLQLERGGQQALVSLGSVDDGLTAVQQTQLEMRTTEPAPKQSAKQSGEAPKRKGDK